MEDAKREEEWSQGEEERIGLFRKRGTAPGVGLRVRKKGELVYLTAPKLEEQGWVRHGFTTRLGGVSRGTVGTMNMTFAREENQENVRENYRRITDALGVSMERLVFSHQTHTTNIRVVTERDEGKGILRPRDYQDVDGLVTNVPGLTLAVFMADCVPLLVADPVSRAVGAAHSGWRGTVGDIGKNLLETMRQVYGTRAEDVICVIGPSICQDCYEVSEDVAECFRQAYAPGLWDRLLLARGKGKYRLDLWEACRQNFLRAFVRPENIEVTDICTHCCDRLLFSHRRLGGRQGNLAALISPQP